MLTTFSVPLLSTFYFLHSTEANGVRFGMYGWCLDDYEICSSVKQVNWTCITPSIAHRTVNYRLGYTWEPQLAVPISSALVLYPISTWTPSVGYEIQPPIIITSFTRCYLHFLHHDIPPSRYVCSQRKERQDIYHLCLDLIRGFIFSLSVYDWDVECREV